MNLSYRLIVASLRAITSLICRIDSADADRIPMHGPLIIYTNHVNILEIPIIFTRLQPRKLHGMLLAERWNLPVVRWMLDVTGSIPLHRGEADIDAIHRALDVLEQGEIVIISPEGTRSHNGELQPAHPGAVLLALHSRSPLLPVAYYGAERWLDNLKHFKRTVFHMKVGKPFHLEPPVGKITHTIRQQIMDEMMYQLALILPPEYRGYYSHPPSGIMSHLVFAP